MIRKMLLLTDFTDLSQKAQEHAKELAGALQAELYVLHLIEPVQLAGLEKDKTLALFMQKLEEEARSKVEAIGREMAEAGVRVNGEVLVGRTFETTIEYVQKNQIDLLVMGSHGLNQGEDSYVGTLSHRVFFLSNIPTLFVR